MDISCKISVVVPVYNEEANIKPLLSCLHAFLSDCGDYEVLFIDDGSTDSSLQILRDAYQANPRVRFIALSRNFGHQNALRAGLAYATGDAVITMDADLQHPPDLIPFLIARWRDGYDIVCARRSRRNALPVLKRFSSHFYYRILNVLADIETEEGVADFRLLDRKVVDVLRGLPEGNLFLRGMVGWLGFRRCVIDYDQPNRRAGETKYTFRKMIRLGMQGVTSFSVRPLRLATFFGLCLSAIALIYAIYAVAIHIFTDKTINGWTSLIVSVLLFGGIQMLLLGIIGEYLGRLFIESKRRPDYIIREKSP
jgi:dolichol-phosphate mannosyltransferase